MLARKLSDAVGREWTGGEGFGSGDLFGIAVDSAAGGGKDHFPDLSLDSALHEVEEAFYVNVGVAHWVFYGDGDESLSGEVKDAVGLFLRDDFYCLGIGDVELDKLGLGVKVVLFAGSEIVDNDDFVTLLD